MQNTQYNPQKTLDLAMQNMQKGQYSNALQLFKQLEDKGMQDHRLYRAMGSAYERVNDQVRAREYFGKSLALNPKQADLHFASGNIAFAKKAIDQAQASFQQAVDLSPQNLGYWHKLAMCLLTNKKFQKAQDAFDLIIKRDPQNIDAYIGKSRVYVAMGSFELAQKLLLDTLATDPKQATLANELGWLFKDSGMPNKAISWFAKRLELDPQNADAFEDLALAWLDNGDVKKAIQVVNNGIELNVEDQKLNKLLATIKFEFGYKDHLEHYYALARKKMPDGLFYDYVQNLIKADNIPQAQEELSKAQDRLQNPQLALSLQLSLWSKQNKHVAIIETLQQHSKRSGLLDQLQIEMLTKAYLAIGEGSQAIGVIKPQLERFSHDQYYWALYTTALRQIDSDLYQNYCNYGKFVFQEPLQISQNHSDIVGFNQELKHLLESLHIAKQNPLDQSLVGGTQTVGMLLNRQNTIIVEFKKALRLTFERAFATIKFDPNHPVARMAKRDFQFSSSWSVKLNNQGFHVSHVHPKGWYSSAYYVDLPAEMNTESKNGWLHLGKPGLFLEQPMQVERWIKPEIGHLVLFPSYFWHGTEPFESPSSRLSVGLDIIPG